MTPGLGLGQGQGLGQGHGYADTVSSATGSGESTSYCATSQGGTIHPLNTTTLHILSLSIHYLTLYPTPT